MNRLEEEDLNEENGNNENKGHIENIQKNIKYSQWTLITPTITFYNHYHSTTTSPLPQPPLYLTSPQLTQQEQQPPLT